MAEETKSAQSGTVPPKVRMVNNPLPPEEIYVDGVSGAFARGGVLKFDCYRVTGFDRNENVEMRTITHRLVLPAVMVPELVRLFQTMANAGRRRAEGEAAEPEA